MNKLPPHIGIGLKAQHYEELLNIAPEHAPGWLEVHPENYMGAGGLPHDYLTRLADRYALSMHGVGMSLGSADGVDETHLQRLKILVDRYQPAQVSEHLSWSHWNATFLNDLLPLPYTKESLAFITANIQKVQDTLGRTIIIENPSTYIDFKRSDYSEPDFFKRIVATTGCGLLLDINNVFVSASNNTFDPYQYIDDYPTPYVEEVHLAGHSIKPLTDTKSIRIDDHGSPVRPEVWHLFDHFIRKVGRALPTLIEWDTDIPELTTLLHEASMARQHISDNLSERADKPQ